MLLFRQVDEVAYACCLYAMFWSSREESTEVEGLDCLSLCCLEPSHDKFYLVRDAVKWWCEHDFERGQRMNVKGRRFDGWHYLEMFAIPPRERDIFYQAVQDICLRARVLLPFVFQHQLGLAYMMCRA